MIYPGKTILTSLSLTEETLKRIAKVSNILEMTQSDIIESLLRGQVGKPPIIKTDINGKRSVTTVKLTPLGHGTLEQKSRELGISMSGYVELLIQNGTEA